MFDKELKVGDYIFNANGTLARITKINKQSYSYVDLTNSQGYYQVNGLVRFNGLSAFELEWFYCDDAQRKAFESAMKRYNQNKITKSEIEHFNDLLGRAKYFLNQINDIEEIEDDDDDEDDEDLDF